MSYLIKQVTKIYLYYVIMNARCLDSHIITVDITVIIIIIVFLFVQFWHSISGQQYNSVIEKFIFTVCSSRLLHC